MSVFLLVAPLFLGLGLALVSRRTARAAVVLGAATTWVLAVYALAYPARLLFAPTAQPWLPSLGVSLKLSADSAALMLVALAATIGLAVAALGWRALGVHSERGRAAVLGGTLLAASINFLARDAVLYYASFEAAIWPALVVLFLRGHSAAAQTGAQTGAQPGTAQGPKVALRFFLYTFAGSLCMLLAFVYLAWRHQALAGGALTFDLAVLGNTVLPLGEARWCFLALLAAFAIKLPLIGVHGWLPRTYAEAPAGLVALLTGLLSKLGAYGLFRIALPLFPATAHRFGPTITVIALVGCLYAGLCALRFKSLRLTLAYSSVAHLALLPLGLFSMEPSGLEGFMLAMVAHGLSASGLFLLVGWLEERAGALHDGELSSDRPWGLASVIPRFAVLFVAFTLASLALPGTLNFAGEFLLFLGGFSSSALHPWSRSFVLTALVSVVLGAAYGLGLVRRVLFGAPRDGSAPGASAPDLAGPQAWGFWGLFVVIVGLGFAPHVLQSPLKAELSVYRETFQSRLQSTYLDDEARLLARGGGLDVR